MGVKPTATPTLLLQRKRNRPAWTDEPALRSAWHMAHRDRCLASMTLRSRRTAAAASNRNPVKSPIIESESEPPTCRLADSGGGDGVYEGRTKPLLSAATRAQEEDKPLDEKEAGVTSNPTQFMLRTRLSRQLGQRHPHKRAQGRLQASQVLVGQGTAWSAPKEFCQRRAGGEVHSCICSGRALSPSASKQHDLVQVAAPHDDSSV